MLRAGLAVGMILFGLAGALLGGVVLVSTIRTGGITVSYGAGAQAVTEVLTYAAEPMRFLKFAGFLGLAPFVFGLVMARYGFRTLQSRRSGD